MPKPMISHGAAPALFLAALLLAGCGNASGMRVPGLAPNWSGAGPDFPTESATIQRIRVAPVAEPNVLTVEPGNVWPEPEAERTTLADPDAALRGLPRVTFPDPPRQAVPQRFPPRVDGQVIPTPQGGVVTTGGTERMQGTLSPRGSGVAIRDGSTVTVLEPGQPPQVVPAPR